MHIHSAQYCKRLRIDGEEEQTEEDTSQQTSYPHMYQKGRIKKGLDDVILIQCKICRHTFDDVGSFQRHRQNHCRDFTLLRHPKSLKS